MSAQTFVQRPERTDAPDLWWLRSWLPAWGQVRTALTLQVEQVIAPWDEEAGEATNRHTTSMRQGLGLVVAAALIGGLLPLLVHWGQAMQIGTATPLAALARYAEAQSNVVEITPFTQAWTNTARTIAGLEPMAPTWLAAGVSALGNWLNWPLTWLTIWLVYGLGVLATVKFQGATTTLPHFYGATSYAFAPLALQGLGVIPYLGPLFNLAGIIWAVLIYGETVRALTSLPTQRVVVSLLTPLAVFALLALISASLLALIFLPLWM
jgi:Yip1 domain